MIFLLRKISVAFCLLLATPFSFAANAVIDVMAVYTNGTADTYGGDPTTRINQVFQVANQIYKDSNVNIELRLVKTLKVDYTDDNSADIALNDITQGKTVFSVVAAAREQAKADMVILYRPYKAVQGSCGIAWIGGQGTNGDFSNPGVKNYMFSHIAINSCGDFVTAHELGHNMGLKHSRKQDGSGGTFPYALGYGVMNQFTTIMAYQSEFNVDYWTGKLYKFSNPELTCKGVPCGVSRTDTVNGADAHYALNIAGPQIAKFYAGASSSSVASSKSVSSSSVKTEAKSSSSAPKSSAKSSSSSSVKKDEPKPTVTSKSSAASSVKVEVKSSSSSSKAAAVLFTRVPDVAQYRGADWKNEVGRARGLTLDQAKALAAANPKITYFFITKGAQLVLEGSSTFTAKGVFHTGDVVFFSGSPWYGSAPGLADAYEKVK